MSTTESADPICPTLARFDCSRTIRLRAGAVSVSKAGAMLSTGAAVRAAKRLAADSVALAQDPIAVPVARRHVASFTKDALEWLLPRVALFNRGRIRQREAI